MVAVHVDRVIKDGETVSLGGVTLRALWVPGHTQGATVWITTVSEGGKNYLGRIPPAVEIPNAGVQLIGNLQAPQGHRRYEDPTLGSDVQPRSSLPDLFLTTITGRRPRPCRC